MKRNFRILLLGFIAALFCLAAGYSQSGAGKVEGTWEVSPEKGDLNFEFATKSKDHKGHSTFSETIKRADLAGYKDGNNISFSIKKRGGEIAMTGDVSGDKGNG